MFTDALTALIGEIAREINWSLEYEFNHFDRWGDVGPTPQGLFSLPLYTHDLRFTYYEAAGCMPGGYGWLVAHEAQEGFDGWDD